MPWVSEKLGQIFERHVLAPTRYLDKSGANPHANFIGRVLSLPEQKIGAIVYLGIAGAGTALGEPDYLGSAIGIGAVNFIWTSAFYYRPKMRKNPTYFFDTEPKRNIPLTDRSVIQQLEQDYQNFTGRATSTLITCLVTLGVLKAIGLNESYAVATVSAVAIQDIAGDFTSALRAKKVMTGEWNCITSKPEAPKTSRQTAPAVAAPSV